MLGQLQATVAKKKLSPEISQVTLEITSASARNTGMCITHLSLTSYTHAHKLASRFTILSFWFIIVS